MRLLLDRFRYSLFILVSEYRIENRRNLLFNYG